MKRKLFLAILLLLAAVVLFSACRETTTKTSDLSALKWSNQLAFERAQELGYEGTLQDFIDALHGADGKNGVDGKDGKDGINGVDGKDGKDGVGISTLLINSESKLIVVLTNGTTIDLGVVKGPQGERGPKGDPGDTGATGVGVAKTEINDKGELIVTLTDGSTHSAGQLNPANGLSYILDKEENCAVITGRGICPDLQLIIPETIGGYPVTEIASYAFQGDKYLKSVSLPSSVTGIGECAFSVCTGLKSVTIGNSVTNIENSAFSGCTALTSVTFGESSRLASIGSCAFQSCTNLATIAIPDSVTNIENSAFSGCTGLTSVTIPDSVTNIENSAFSGCTSLTSVTFGENSKLESIGQYAFSECTSLTSVTIPDSVTNIENSAFSGCTSLPSVTIPDSVTNIGSSVFCDCSSLTSVTFGENSKLESIGEGAFSNCSSLATIAIPESVTSIGWGAFDGCTSLTSVYITDLAKWCTISFSANYANPLCYAHNLYLNGELVTNLQIPDGVKSIGYSAFSGCTSLTSVTIPNSVKSIGYSAFSGCTSLTSVTIPDSVTSIGSSAFRGCTSLTSVTIPDSVTSIGQYAFSYCTSLTSVTIPESVTSIGQYAFSECYSLTSVTIPDSVTSIGEGAFYSCTSLTEIIFLGTEEEWNDLFKGEDWDNNTGDYTVIYLVSYPTLDEVALEKTGYAPGLPSTGDVNILVIPIAFTNSEYDAEELQAKLELGFSGSAEDAGWRSLAGYYEEVSYGNLLLHPTILAPYQTGVDYDLTTGNCGKEDWAYLRAAIAAYDDEIDYTNYDSNNDGYIDCVYLIYLAPFDESTDLWWAYCYTFAPENEEDDPFFDGKQLCYYLWASVEFFDDPIIEDYVDPENSVSIAANSETIIHETGHALGLDDYYDCDPSSGTKGGIGSFGMMDANQGDHDPYSKAILGWTHPFLTTEDAALTLRSFAATGDTLMISKDNGGSYFEEYFLIAFYTPTGVNEIKKDAGTGFPSQNGVMVWHVDATLRPDEELPGRAAYDITLSNNASTEHKLLDLVCATGSNQIDTNPYYTVSDKDLFASESEISGLTWYDGTAASFTITVGTFDTSSSAVAVNVLFDAD